MLQMLVLYRLLVIGVLLVSLGLNGVIYVNNLQVKNRVMDVDSVNILSHHIMLIRFCRLAHLLRAATTCLSYRTAFSVLLTQWRKPRGSQQMT